MEDRQICSTTRVCAGLQNYKRCQSLGAEVRRLRKEIREYRDAISILHDQIRGETDDMVSNAKKLVKLLPTKEILFPNQFWRYLSGVDDKTMIQDLFGQHDPPTIIGDFEQPLYYDDIASRSAWITKMIEEHLDDPTGLLRVAKPFLIEFMKAGTMDMMHEPERVSSMWSWMLETLRLSYLDKPLGSMLSENDRDECGVILRIVGLLFDLRRGHIDVDEYAKGVSQLQYRVEMAHAWYLHTYGMAYFLFEIFNDGYRSMKSTGEKRVSVDPLRLITGFNALQESTKAVQDVTRYMPWITSVYVCPFHHLSSALYYIDRYMEECVDNQ